MKIQNWDVLGFLESDQGRESEVKSGEPSNCNHHLPINDNTCCRLYLDASNLLCRSFEKRQNSREISIINVTAGNIDSGYRLWLKSPSTASFPERPGTWSWLRLPQAVETSRKRDNLRIRRRAKLW